MNNYVEEHEGGGGGGGEGTVAFYFNGISLAPHTVQFVNCRFESNTGEAGGGLHVFTSFEGQLFCFVLAYLPSCGADGNYFKLERCNFTGNVGLGTNSDYGYGVTLDPIQGKGYNTLS